MYCDHFFSDRMIGSQIYSIEMIEIVIVIATTEKYRDRIAILFLMIDSNTDKNTISIKYADDTSMMVKNKNIDVLIAETNELIH